MKGLFHLQTAKDLLAKLRHDLAQLHADPVDAYAAFDFFVTARHLPEWLYPGKGFKRQRKALFDSSILLQVCRHIADGSKHFEPEAAYHKTVKDTALEGAQFQPGQFQSNQFQVGHLVVHLDGAAAGQLGAIIEVTALAEHVVKFWEAHPDLA